MNDFPHLRDRPKYVAKSVAGEDEEEDLQRHLKDIHFSDKIKSVYFIAHSWFQLSPLHAQYSFPKKFIPKIVAGEDEDEDLKRHLKDIYKSEEKNQK